MDSNNNNKYKITVWSNVLQYKMKFEDKGKDILYSIKYHTSSYWQYYLSVGDGTDMFLNYCKIIFSLRKCFIMIS